MPSVLIVDDHVLSRQGLKQILDQEFRSLVFGEVKALDELSTHFRKRRWDLAVVSVRPAAAETWDALAEIHRHSPSCRIMILSSQQDPLEITRAIELGASGYVSEDAERAVFVKAFHCVLSGKTYFTDCPASDGHPAPVSHTDLSTRELEVMRLIAAGKRSRDIAAQLNISVQTVSTYKHRVLHKMGFASVAELIRYVIDAGLSLSL